MQGRVVDGALPVPDEMYDPEFADRVRRGFRRARLLFPVLNRFGLAGRMTAEQHAEINLDVLQYQTKSALEPILDRVSCPVRYVIGAGGHTGTNDAEMAPVRAGIEPVLRRRPNFEVTARVPVNHEKIVKKCHPEIAQAVREVAAAVGQEPR